MSDDGDKGEGAGDTTKSLTVPRPPAEDSDSDDDMDDRRVWVSILTDWLKR